MNKNNIYPRAIVGIFIFNEKGEILLTKQPRYDNKFVTVGGSIEYKESIKEAALREAKEEANIEIEEIEFINCNEITDLGPQYPDEKRHLIFIHLKAKAKKYNKIKLDSEAYEYKWLTPEAWLQQPDIRESIKQVIEKYFIESDNIEHKYRRALADYQNLLKQTAKDKTEFVKYANQNLLHDLIPAYDNLKTAIDHADEKNHDTWLEGVKYVAKQFKEALKNNGVEEIKTVGEKFDHHTMDAVQNEETDNKKQDGLVAKELKAGYKLNGKVVIPARVIVYKLKVEG